MKNIVIISALLSLMGCEVHSYPSGHTVTKFPAPGVSATVEVSSHPTSGPVYVTPASQDVVIVEEPAPGIIVIEEYIPYYEDHCYGSSWDYCCVEYDYYQSYYAWEPYNWEVCEYHECYDYYGLYWADQNCWYE